MIVESDIGTHATSRRANSLKPWTRGRHHAFLTRSGYDLGDGIGIAHGPATLGVVGYEGRSEYTALGSVVNLAARLSDQGDRQILLDLHDRTGRRVRGRAMRQLIIVALAAVVLAACSDDAKTGAPSEATAATTTTTVHATSTTEFAGVEPGAYKEYGDYVDGRHIGYVVRVDATRRILDIDVAQFLTGDAATKAYQAESGLDDTPPNDYYVKNQNPMTRRFPLEDDAVFRVNNLGMYPPSAPNTGHKIDFAQFTTYFESSEHHEQAFHTLFWITIKGGRLVSVEEQFVP